MLSAGQQLRARLDLLSRRPPPVRRVVEEAPPERLDGARAAERLQDTKRPDDRLRLLPAHLARPSDHRAEQDGRLALLSPIGRFFALGSGIKLAIDARRGRLADIVCFAAGAKLPREGVARTAPELVVEVLSSRPGDQKRDRIAKPEDYAALGARAYWMVDPWLRTLEILELGADGRYVRALAATSGTVANVPGLPGLLGLRVGGAVTRW